MSPYSAAVEEESASVMCWHGQLRRADAMVRGL